ncbi:molybdopterin-dependent oxidoreductase, partial [Chloroflexota bacterium]
LETVVQKLKEIREEDPRKLWLVSFDLDSFASEMRTAMGIGFGTPNISNGGPAFYCGHGFHPVAIMRHGSYGWEPDAKYCKYLMLIGCQAGFMVGVNAVAITNEVADSVVKDMKLVVVDPVMSPTAAKADEWIPIRPGTDAALALAMINVLLNEEKIYDAKFLKRYTNSPYLIGPDGHYLRDKATNKPLMWNYEDKCAKTFDSPDIKDFALEGSFEVNGTSCTTAFQLLKDHVKKYTCEEVSEITTIPTETIRRIAKEFGEAARIGSTIVIKGKELPYRPACVIYEKGIAHKHAMLTGLAIHTLNMIVGSIDVPGGLLHSNSMILPGGPFNYSWEPGESPDGLITAGQWAFKHMGYPAQGVKWPQSMELTELFPVAHRSGPIGHLNQLHPEIFKVPDYKIEALIHCRSNIMISTTNPEDVAQILKRIPFQVSFVQEINETAEFADIILPDAHYFERLDMFPNQMRRMQLPGLTDWVWEIRQPVVEPPPGVRHWLAVLFEDIADGVGFREEMYSVLNRELRLKEPYQLDLDKKYSWEEFCDIQAKAWFGPEHDLAWFKEHGFLTYPKRVEEAYPRPFIKPRIPIYQEHFIKAGEDVKKMTKELGIPWWDTSGYQPLPDWKPCPAYENMSTEYDLYVSNYKFPYQTFTVTANNPWLNEVTEYSPYAYYILINSQTAKSKGIRGGDVVRLETEMGYAIGGMVKVTEGVHPEVLGTGGISGHWARGLPIAKGSGVHWNRLIPLKLECIDFLSGGQDMCVKVKITKIS